MIAQWGRRAQGTDGPYMKGGAERQPASHELAGSFLSPPRKYYAAEAHGVTRQPGHRNKKWRKTNDKNRALDTFS